MTDLNKDLRQMYDLGYAHGYEMALRDAEIKKLDEEIEETNNE